MSRPLSAFIMDEEDLQDMHWFLGAKNLPPMGPMSGAIVGRLVSQGWTWAAEKLSLPATKACICIIKDNTTYYGVVPVKGEQESKEREGRFREALTPFIERFDELWDGMKSEIMQVWKPLRELDLEKASDMDLLDAFIEGDRRAGRRMWNLHFYAMEGVMSLYILFEGICKELFGIDDTSSTFQSLVSGFDNKIFEGDSWLWRLSVQARELGLADLFQSTDAKGVAAALNESDAGRDWLKELDAYHQEFGWKLWQTFHWAVPSWREEPSLAIGKVQSYMRTPEFSLPDRRKALAEEREQVTKELVSRVPQDKREWFGMLLKGAQQAGSWAEEHNFYFDQAHDGVMRRLLLEWGRRLVAAGTMDQRDDIFLMGPEELEKVALCPERYNLRQILNGRRAEWEEQLKPDYAFAPFISSQLTMGEAFGLLVGARDPTFEKVIVGVPPSPKPELKANLLGVSGSPGVAEGPARVLLSVGELAQVQPGEILVCASTDPTWTPVFVLLKGVVVDMGGSLCHAAIVSREYGIPCVLNTFAGTGTIKTGQRIRVDGNTGAVYIVEGK